MGEDDNHGIKYYWEKYLPCRLHRKNVVLICLTICCFALVTWTVVATIENPDAPKNPNGTVEVPFVVDDSKELDVFNLTTQSARKRETVREMEAEVRRKHGFKGPIKTVLREILNATNQNQTLCKCLCRRVGEMDLIHGLYKQMEQMAEEAKRRLENPHLGGGGGMGGMGGGGEEEEYEYGEDYGNYDDLEDTGADEDTGFDT